MFFFRVNTVAVLTHMNSTGPKELIGLSPEQEIHQLFEDYIVHNLRNQSNQN